MKLINFQDLIPQMAPLQSFIYDSLFGEKIIQNALGSATNSIIISFEKVRICYARCGMVWCGVVWCGVVWCGVVWCGVVWCGVVWCGVVWCGMVTLRGQSRSKFIAERTVQC